MERVRTNPPLIFERLRKERFLIVTNNTIDYCAHILADRYGEIFDDMGMDAVDQWTKVLETLLKRNMYLKLEIRGDD